MAIMKNARRLTEPLPQGIRATLTVARNHTLSPGSKPHLRGQASPFRLKAVGNAERYVKFTKKKTVEKTTATTKENHIFVCH